MFDFIKRFLFGEEEEETITVRALVGQNRFVSVGMTVVQYNIVLAYLAKGKKVNAIKYVRTLSNMGLKEAKAIVDQIV